MLEMRSEHSDSGSGYEHQFTERGEMLLAI